MAKVNISHSRSQHARLRILASTENFRSNFRIISRTLILLWLLLSSIATAIEVNDDLGNTVSLQAPSQRLITLSPATTEIALAAGGQHQLIAANSGPVKVASEVVQISTLGGLDRELLLTLKPDLVLAWGSGNRTSDIAWLKSQGIAVYLSEPADMAQLAASIRNIGRLLATETIASQAAANFLARLDAACRELPDQSVYIAIWDSPAMSLGGHHWMNDLLARGNLHNTYQAIERGVFAIEREAQMSQQGRLQLAPDGPPSAVPQRITVSNLSRPGPSLAQGLESLCETLSSGL